MAKIRIKYIDCGHERPITQREISRGDLRNLECKECKKKKPKKGTLNPSPA
jgi:hypothetical protein